MIDGKDIADNLLHARKMGHGVVLTTDSTAALSSYIEHLRSLASWYKSEREEYSKLKETHAPYVRDLTRDYIGNVEDALAQLNRYLDGVESASLRHQPTTKPSSAPSSASTVQGDARAAMHNVTDG